MSNFGNRILDSLSPADQLALQPHLRKLQLQQRQIVYQTDECMSLVYFPTSACISLVMDLSTGNSVEAAMVGRDGALGASAALEGQKSLNRAIVQLPGTAFVCEARALASTFMQSASLIATILRHERALFMQAQQSAACISAHPVEARMCRWLLRARDLHGSDTLDFTHEFLAEMLGAQRSTVTLAAQSLQESGLIEYRRGKIRIVNVDGMREAVCECYEAVKARYLEI